MSDSTRDTTRIDVRRSFLGRARGLGAAHSGVHHWRVERVTAIALVPLTLWFIYAVLHLSRKPYPMVVEWVAHPWNAVLLLALIAMTFHHMQLGIQVVLEDYVRHKWFMSIALLANKGIALILALASALAVLKMAI